MSCGNELELLLSDVRWSKRRMKVGGIVALRDDFDELSRATGGGIGAEAVRSALEECWMKTTKNIHETPFELHGRLRSHLQSSEFVNRFLSSVLNHIPKPYFVPKQDVRWRAHSGQLMRFDFVMGVDTLCLSKDQNIVAVAQGNEIHVFDKLAKRNLCALQGHEDKVTSVAMSDDGSRIVSGSRDNTVRVWDGHSGQCVLGPLLGHGSWVSCVAMSSDGSRIVSGSHDNTVRVWDGITGRYTCAVLQCGNLINLLEFDGGSDMCVVEMSNEAFLFNTSNGTKVHRSGYIFTGSHSGIYATLENAEPIQVATTPTEIMTICHSRLYLKAAVGLSDGQVIVGELVL